MRNLKDSGVQWIGEMPSHWSLNKGKYLLTLLQKPTREDDGVITCFRDGEVTLRSNRREDGFTIAEKEIGYQGVDVGDLVVHGMDGFAGAIGISDSRGKASPVLNVLDSSQNKKYIMYYLRAMAYGDVFLGLATGIRVRSCDLRWNKLAETIFPVPPLKEQEEIVRHLDKKCAEIDALMESIRGEIEFLITDKISEQFDVLSHGLSAQGETKNSGIPWLPIIPAHWSVKKVKHGFANHKTIVGQFCENYERLALTMNGVIKRPKDDNTGLQPEKFETYQILRKGELVFKLIDLQNISTSRVGYSPYTGIVSPAYIILRPDGTILSRFAEKYFYLLWKNQVFNALGDAGVRSNLNASDLLNLPMPVPPLKEQEEIARFLENKCSEIDEIIKRKESQLEVLDSYKKSLIYEYVTGKRR